MITLHALLVRRADLTHEEFLAYWHGTHGPLIRDDPALTRHLLSYHQHPLAPQADDAGFGGFDGITVQTFPDWATFWAFVTQPESAAMNADMANFLDPERLQVTVTDDPVVVVDAAAAPEPAS